VQGTNRNCTLHVQCPSASYQLPDWTRPALRDLWEEFCCGVGAWLQLERKAMRVCPQNPALLVNSRMLLANNL
jgi:hypothetical protein